MLNHSVHLSPKTFALLCLTLLLSQQILADTISTNTGNNQSAVNSHSDSVNKPQHILLDENLTFQLKSNLATEYSETQSELNKFLGHEQESHLHLGGDISFNDDARIMHPSVHDIGGFEIDLTIDFD